MNLIEPFISALGWALVHSIWQIALVGIIVWIILGLSRDISSSRKHRIVLVGLAAVFLSFSYTTGLYISNSKVSDTIKPESFQQQELINTSLDLETHPTIPINQEKSFLYRVQNYIAANTNTIAGVWMLGFMIFLIRFTGSSLYIHRLRSRYADALEETWQAMGNQIRNNLLIKRSIRILESDLIQVPITTGFLRPVIILPLGLVTHIPFNQLEAIITHEMAHIQRHDYLINVFRSLLEALFFYHPIFWWLSRKLELYREHACDDVTINHCGSSEPLQRALLDLSSIKPKAANPAAALFQNPNHLLNRIKRMKTSQNNPKRRGNLAGFILFPAIVLTLALASAFAPRITEYPDLSNAAHPPIEIRSETPVIPSNPVEEVDVVQEPEPLDQPNPVPETTPDSTQKTIGVKAKTEEGYILLEFDEDMNLQKITKNGKEVQGEEKEKYQRLADKTQKVFHEEEKMKQRQQELELLEEQLENVQKRMQEVQEEYSELWQSYREKSMLDGHFQWPDVYADVFSDIPAPPPSFDVYPFYRDIPYPDDSAFQRYIDFDFENGFDPVEFDDQMKRSMDLYEDALRSQERVHEERMQKYKLQQEKQYKKAKQYRVQQELIRVFEKRIKSELIQDELIDGWDDLESFELTADFMKVNGEKQSKKLHQKYQELYESVMEKKLEGKIRIH
jgi:beta-lactamase regulating signal transducer with metallopeptidase domain